MMMHFNLITLAVASILFSASVAHHVCKPANLGPYSVQARMYRRLRIG